MASTRYASYLEEEDWDLSTLELVNKHLEKYLKMLPGGGANLTLAELQGLAARQQVAMDTQQQALVARETRLKYLQQQEARHRQLASEQSRLQRMKERVEAQELKLKKLRALRGQVEQHKASNGGLNSELETVRTLFNEKEKELAVAVSKVDQLMRQLQDLRQVKVNGGVTHGNHLKGDANAVALELEKLRNELLFRNKQNDQQNSRLSAQRQVLKQKKDEASSMDNRIEELQQRLRKRRSQQQQQQQLQPQPQQQTKNNNNNNNNGGVGGDAGGKHSHPRSGGQGQGHGRKPGQHHHHQNIAAVEPYIQYAPKDMAKDDLYSKTGFLKQDPKYQTLPANTKFIPSGEEGGSSKPLGVGGGGGQEVNNNNTTNNKSNNSGGGGGGDTVVTGVKPAGEHKIPSLISSHFGAHRSRSTSGTRTGVAATAAVADNQGKGVVGVSGVSASVGGSGATSKASSQPQPQPTQVSNSATTQQQQQQPTAGNNNNGVSKGPRPFVNTFAKQGLPKWPPAKEDEPQPQQQQPSQQPHHQPQINIFDEERQAGSGQSSPASSEGSGPLVKQGSGVFALPASSLAQPGNAKSDMRQQQPQQHPGATSGSVGGGGGGGGPPLEPRGFSASAARSQGPKPPPRMPQGTASVKPVVAGGGGGGNQGSNPPSSATAVVADARTGSVGGVGDDADSSKLSVNDSINVNPGPPQAQSTPQGPDGMAGSPSVHLNQRPAPTYRYASKNVIANTYMGRLGGAAMERYQQLNKQLYTNNNLDANGKRIPPGPGDSTTPTATAPVDAQKPSTGPELRTTFGSHHHQQQPQPSSDPSVTSGGVGGQSGGGGGGGMTHFGLVGSPNYPDIASDKGSFKSNTPKHLRRRHSDSDNEDLAKVLHRGDKAPLNTLENVAEDANANTNNNNATAAKAEPKPQNSNSNPATAAQRLGSDGSAKSSPPSSPGKVKVSSAPMKKAAVVVRRKKTILKGDNRQKVTNRVSFDPLALLLDASLEGELDLVTRTAKEVDDVSTPNDEGITALHNAICAGHYHIVKFLIEFGADVNSPDSDGWTPLHCAASCNNLPMVRFLVEHGACIFATTISDNETAAEKCEEDEDGYDGCSDYLYSVQEKLGIVHDGAVYAVFDYAAHKQDELSFRINDQMTVLRKGDEAEKEWWWARKGASGTGYIPRNLLGLYPRVLQSNYQQRETSDC